MKQKNKLTGIITKLLVFVVLFTTGTVGITFRNALAATDEVSLYCADSKPIDSAAGRCAKRLTTEIKVKNIAYEKKVSIHYYDSFTKQWKDMAAKYEKPLFDGYELWKVEPTYIGENIEFVLKYEVNGQTYWDNNNGKNYKVPFEQVKAY